MQEKSLHVNLSEDPYAILACGYIILYYETFLVNKLIVKFFKIFNVKFFK